MLQGASSALFLFQCFCPQELIKPRPSFRSFVPIVVKLLSSLSFSLFIYHLLPPG